MISEGIEVNYKVKRSHGYFLWRDNRSGLQANANVNTRLAAIRNFA